MAKNAFERFIQRCGTVKKAANILRTSHQNVSSMRNGRTWVKHSYAKRVADYLWEEMNYKLDPLDLVSPLEKNKLKSLSLPFTQHAIKLINISISQVRCEAPKPNLNAKDKVVRLCFDTPLSLRKAFKLKATTDDKEMKQAFYELMKGYVDGKFKLK